MSRNSWWRTAAMALSLVLAGCGGGGGGGGGGDDDLPPPPPPTTSGLLPAAPVPGATLYEDGVALQGLKDGAVMTYQGSGTDLPAPYTNRVTHAGIAGGFTETHHNPDSTGESLTRTLLVADGTVSEQGLFQVAPGAPVELLSFVEIRSPVRVDDRYVHLDRHYQDVGFDADGDAKNEALDLAAWRQVVGLETLDLPLRRQVTAVRVDDTLRMRVRYTTDGSYSDVIELRGSKWFVMGLGVVKSVVDSPADTGDARIIHTEELIERDGLDSGLGHTAALALTAPPSSNIAGQAVPLPDDFAAFAEYVTILSTAPSFEQGIVLTQIDLRGRAMASTLHRHTELFGQAVGRLRMTRVGEGLHVVTEANEAGLAMVRLDGTGQQRQAGAPVVLTDDELYSDLDSSSFVLQGTSDGLWVGWLTYPVSDDEGNSASRLLVRRFDVLGQPMTDVLTAHAGVHPGGLEGVRMAQVDGHAVLVWSEISFGQPQWHFAVFSPSGQTLANQALGVDCAGDFVPHDMQGAAVLSCTGSPTAGAVTLDGAWQPKRQADGSARVHGGLPPGWVQNQGPLIDLAGDAAGLVFAGWQYGPMWPGNEETESFVRVDELPLVDGLLDASQGQAIAKWLPVEMSPTHLVPYPDRILVIGTDCRCQGGTLRTSVIWRP